MDIVHGPEGKFSHFWEVTLSPKLERLHLPKSAYMYVTSRPTYIKFLSRFQSIKFFDDHGLKGKFRRFWEVILSPKLERLHPPKPVYMHVTSRPTCINFLSQFWWIKFFANVHGPKGKFGCFWEVILSLKLERLCPPKSVNMHVTSRPTCIYFFELIPMN